MFSTQAPSSPRHLLLGERSTDPKLHDNMQNFNGSTGRAFLFEEVVNVELGEAEDRHMTTGLHNVRDIFCIRCNLPLGWRYVSQARPSSLHTGALLLGADALPLTSHHATLALGLTGQDKAYVSAEKYKEGKFILEVSLLCLSVS